MFRMNKDVRIGLYNDKGVSHIEISGGGGVLVIV